VGLYGHLHPSWSDHPFAFSSFKIKYVEQINTVRALVLARIRYSTRRSDVQPTPQPAVDAFSGAEPSHPCAPAPVPTVQPAPAPNNAHVSTTPP